MSTALCTDRIADLMDPDGNILLDVSIEEALARLDSGDPAQLRGIDGHFALAACRDNLVRMARTIARPMRYFLAKRDNGPFLIIAERIDEIRQRLRDEGLEDQFHPSYTRMVPAHYLVELPLVGCPDPNPQYRRFFTPEEELWPADLDEIGKRYVGVLRDELARWLQTLADDEPIGVSFSGGIDSGAVVVLLDHLLGPAEADRRLKAFTLSMTGQGSDIDQARRFLHQIGREGLLEPVAIEPDELDARETVRLIEDYKPLDVQSAAMAAALCRRIRQRYPDWRWLVDGDGGDENLKDYPLQDNAELTIRSVLTNRLLYQEGWGIDKVKHSLTYSGGQSRGHVRSWAPARYYGFRGFSPYALPNVIEVAERIPFVALTDWDENRLYALKGEVVRRGIEALTGVRMPVFPKRRFQEGVAAAELLESRLPRDERLYRRIFGSLFDDR